jgi:ATP-binding cassette, subfamily B, multidrug efflux pump
MRPFKRLLSYMAAYRTTLALGISGLLASNLLKAAVPVVVQHAVDTLIRGITRPLLFRYSALVTALALLHGGLLFLQDRLLPGIARCIERDMKNDFYAHLQKFPMKFFQENRTGDLMVRATNDLAIAVNSGIEGLTYSANTLVALTIILPLMARLSGRLTLLAFSPLLLVTISTLMLRKRMLSSVEEVQKSFGKLCVRVQEVLSAVKTVRAYTQEHAEVELFKQINGNYLYRNLRRIRLSGLLYPVLQFFIGLSFVAVLWYGGDLTANGSLSIGQFLEFILYLGYLAWPMHDLGSELNALQRGVVSMGRVESIFSLQPPIQSPLCPADIQNIGGAMEFRQVTFAYQGAGHRALDGISFRVRPGQTVGLVGAVGSGKSTLMNMVPRLLDPDSGQILIGEYPICETSLQALRSAIGYVSQETFLFSDTIAANIAFGKPEASQQEIEWAAINAGIDSDIAAFPNGYQTFVGERGVTLSGGQKQRIGIARALLRQPEILLLDDPFSSIDSSTEEMIWIRLRKFMTGKTCLISSQRVSSIRGADLIVMLHEGRVVEQGTHDELLANGELYAQMYASQLLEEDLTASS